MKLIEKSKDKLSFVTEIDETLVNAIRRSVNEISVLAINLVEMYKNDSALYDEIIAHRLGLIPLKEKRKLMEFEKCSCEDKGCNKCQIQLSLKAKGPGNVYAEELKGDVEVLYGKTPIVILEKDQELQAVCFASLGKSLKHAKFSPGLFYYRNVSDIKINNSEEADAIISKIKETLINPPKAKIKSGEVYKSYMDQDYIENMFIKENKSVEITPGEEIVFFIESWGQIDPKEILSEAVKALGKNLKEVIKEIK